MQKLDFITRWLTVENVGSICIAIIFLFLGRFAARRLSDAVGRVQRLDASQKAILQKVTFYGIYGMAIAMSLSQLGVDLKVVLGAAGVLTVAVGFAAQTSASNLISGLFLIIERPFGVGDIIDVDRFRGEVLAIDLLSCRIRTFDNLHVRIPNETMVKSSIVNRSFFPIRRVEVLVGVSYNADARRVQSILIDLCKEEPLVLQNPAPVCVFDSFGASSIDFKLMAWGKIDVVDEIPSKLRERIKLRLEAEKIEIPYPHQVILSPVSG